MPVFTLPKSSHPDFAVPGVKPKGPVEIDWGAPSSAGLVQLVLDENIDLRNKVKGSQLDLVDVTFERGNIDFAAGASGDRNSRIEYGDAVGTLPIVDVFTHETVIETRSYVSLAGYWGAGTYDGAINPGNGSIRALISFSNNIYFFGGSADWNTGIAWSTLIDGNPHSIIFTSNGTNIYLYVDGEQKASTTTPAFVEYDSGSTYKIGAGHSSMATDGDFVFYKGAMYDRFMSEGEAELLGSEPYRSVLKPAIPLTYFVPAAAPAGGNEPLFYHHQRMLSRCS